VIHPSAAELLRYALEREQDVRIDAHLRSCEPCAAEAAQLTAQAMLLAGLEADDQPCAMCLDVDVVAAMAAGELAPYERSEAVRHLSECSRCRNRVADVAGLLRGGPVARALGVVDQPRRRLSRSALVPAAALVAATVILLFNTRKTEAPVPTHRGATGVQLIALPGSPVGIVTAADTFRWPSIAGADRYRIRIFDHSGAVLLELVTTDTVLARPDSIGFIAGKSYLWTVAAHTGFDRWSSSLSWEFSMSPEPRP
jgi:anti-sigma factor RsiW